MEVATLSKKIEEKLARWKAEEEEEEIYEDKKRVCFQPFLNLEQYLTKKWAIQI